MTSCLGRLRTCAAALTIVVALGACQGSNEPAAPATSAAAGTSATSTGASPSTPAAVPAGPATTRPTPTGIRPSPSTTARPTVTTPQPTRPTSTRTPTKTPTTPAPTTCSIPSRLLGRDLTTLGTDRKVVALTFDAGSGNEAVASILRTLEAQHVPGSFFLTGQFVDDFPSSARAIAARYPVGNHTYRHPDLTTLSSSSVRSELRTAAARIKAVTGQDPRPWFRFPFGAVDARTISVVNAECYVPFRWTVDTLGWKGTSGGQSVTSVVSRVVAAARPGEIVLMHVGAHPTDHSTLDADALPLVISQLRARGYTFTTLAAVIGPAP